MECGVRQLGICGSQNPLALNMGLLNILSKSEYLGEQAIQYQYVNYIEYSFQTSQIEAKSHFTLPLNHETRHGNQSKQVNYSI